MRALPRKPTQPDNKELDRDEARKRRLYADTFATLGIIMRLPTDVEMRALDARKCRIERMHWIDRYIKICSKHVYCTCTFETQK